VSLTCIKQLSFFLVERKASYIQAVVCECMISKIYLYVGSCCVRERKIGSEVSSGYFMASDLPKSRVLYCVFLFAFVDYR